MCYICMTYVLHISIWYIQSPETRIQFIQSRPGHVGIHGAEAPKALRQVPLCHQELPQRGARRTYVGMYVCMHACMHVCMHACMYVCM